MISVIIPYLEDRGYLQDCKDSIENQTFRDFEIIESVGGTLGENVNKGVKKAKGEFIKIVAEDDLLTPNSLEDLNNGIGNYDWAVANAFDFGKTGESKRLGLIPNLQSMLIRNEVHGGSTLYRSNLWGRFGGWDEGLKTAEEYDWHLKLLSNDTNVTYVNSEVYKYRIWSGSKSQHWEMDGSKIVNVDFEKKKLRLGVIEEIKARYK